MAEGLNGAILGLFDFSKIRIKAEDVTGLKEALAAQSAQIAVLSADLAAANAQINALANAVTPMANEIAGKASASAVAVLNARVGQIEGDADRFRADGIMRVNAADTAGNHAMSPSVISTPQTAADLADDLRAGLEKLAAWLRDGIAPDDKIARADDGTITAKAEAVTYLNAVGPSPLDGFTVGATKYGCPIISDKAPYARVRIGAFVAEDGTLLVSADDVIIGRLPDLAAALSDLDQQYGSGAVA